MGNGDVFTPILQRMISASQPSNTRA